MARTGTASILKNARKICKMVNIYGAIDLVDRTTPEFGAAVTALVVACTALEALDDFVGQIDNTGPLFSGDPDGPPL